MYVRTNKPVLKRAFYMPGVTAILFLVGNLFAAQDAFGQTNTWDGSTSTAWNTASNWSLNLVPTTAHDVVIPNTVPGANDNPVVNANAQCLTLTFSTGNAAVTLTINAGITLTVSNATTINTGTAANAHKVIAVGSGTFESGSVTLAATGNVNRNSRITIAAGGTVTVTGSITMGDANDQVTFTGTGILNVGGNMTGGTFTASTGTVVYNGAAQTCGVYTYNNLTLTGSNTKTFATTPTVNAILSLEGTASVSVTGAGVVTYGPSATLQYNKPAAYVTTGEEWIPTFNGTGGVIIRSTGIITMDAAKVLGTNAPLNINVGATLGTGNFDLTFNGNFINDGTFTAGSSPIIISGNVTQSIDGFATTGLVSMTKTGNTATFTDNVNGGALSINGTGGTLNLGIGLTHDFTGDWTRAAGTLNGASSELRIGGNASGTGGTFSASTGTVEWYASGAQTLADVNYSNLTLSGSGIKTLQAGTTIISGNLILSGTASTTTVAGLTIGGSVTFGAGTGFTAGAFTHNVAGNWTNNGGTFNGVGSTINLNGAAQSIGGTSSTTFNNLSLTGSNTKTFGIATFTTNDLSMTVGVVANLGTFTTHTANRLFYGLAGHAAGTWGGTTSGAANINTTIFASALGILTVAVSAPSTYFSRQTGNWNASATWSTITYGNATNNGTFPVAGDIVNIGGGDFTVTVNVNSACTSLSYQANVSNSPTVSLNGGITLNVSGAIDIPATSAFTGDNNTLAVGAGTLNGASLTFSAGGFLGGQRLTISTGTATITGDIAHSGGLAQAVITFTGAGRLTAGGGFGLNSINCAFTASTGTVDYNSSAVTQNMGNFTYNNLILSGIGSKTVAGALDINGAFTLGAGTNFTAGGYTHTLAGNWINNGTTFDNTNSTFSLDGAAQSIGGTSPTTFYNLTLAGTNTKTFGQSTTMDGSLAINSGVVANLGTILTHTARALSLNGGGQVPGTWGSTASVATNQNNTFFTASATGILTVIARAYYSRQTGDWNVNATWSTDTYGSVTNTGTFPVAADIANIGGGNFIISVNVNSACTTLSYQGNAGNSPTVSINAGMTLNVSGAISIPATAFFSGDVNTLAVGAGTLNAQSLEFASGGLLGAKALTISTGTATITGDVSNSGLSTATITFTGAGLLILRGDFLNSGNCTFTRGTGTVEYSSTTVAQTIGDFTYHNLTLNNSFGTAPQLSLIANTTAMNTLAMTSGIVNLNGSTFTLGSSGAASILTRTASLVTNWMYGGSFRRFWPTGQTPSPSAGNFYGLFPLGHSTASSYRPVAVTGASNITTTGSVTFTHVNATTSTDLSPVYNDAGVNIVRKHNSQFIGSATGIVGGTNYTITATMTDLLPGTASDIRLAVSNGTSTVTNVGAHVANTGTAPNPTVGRSGLSVANLTNDFRITSANIVATPLPIKLLYFHANVQGEEVNTTWATAQEINNDFFTVEKSSNPEYGFQTVSKVAGKGNSNVEQEYSLVDKYPYSGLSYYRLKQTDFDGKFTYSKLVSVNYEGSSLASLSVYPNPLKDKQILHVEMTGLKGMNEIPIRIYNSLGQKILEKTIMVNQGGRVQEEFFFEKPLSAGVFIVKAGPSLQLTQRLVVE